MKAIILAAGKGERLKDITQTLPKPMIEFRGKPILQHNIELCKKYGIEDIYINIHHLPEKITNYFGDGKKFGVSIKYSYETELLGTAGAVKKIAKEFLNIQKLQDSNIPLLQSSDPFFVIYGDNFSNYDLNLLIEKQQETNSSCVIGFHYREDTSHSGVAEFDKDGRILRFIEKPKQGESDSHWVNAGVYLLNSSTLDLISDGFFDFGKDVFPLMLGKNIPMYGICSHSEVKAFDNLEMYNKSFETHFQKGKNLNA